MSWHRSRVYVYVVSDIRGACGIFHDCKRLQDGWDVRPQQKDYSQEKSDCVGDSLDATSLLTRLGIGRRHRDTLCTVPVPHPRQSH